MTMLSKWKGKRFNRKEQKNALKDAKSFINESHKEMFSVKIASSDINHGDSRVAVFWRELEDDGVFHEPLQITVPPMSVEWDYEVFSTKNSYGTLTNKVCAFLDSLEDYQQYYASITFSNASTTDAYMSVWYPKKSTEVKSQPFTVPSNS